MNKSSSTPFSDPAQTWNNRFSKDAYVFGTEPNEWLRRQASVWNAASKILCVADGEGRNSVWLAKQGHQVDAFDISDVGVAKARRLALDCGTSVNFAVASCDDFEWPKKQYEGVAAIFVQFADPELRARMFENIIHSLKPGGSLVLVTTQSSHPHHVICLEEFIEDNRPLSNFLDSHQNRKLKNGSSTSVT